MLSGLPNYDRVVVAVSLALLGLGLSLTLEQSTFWLLMPVLVGVVCLGSDSVLTSHPRAFRQSLGDRLVLCILPGLLVLGAALFLRLVAGGYWLVGGLAATGLLLAGALLGQYRTLDPRDEGFPLARMTLNLASYLVAFSLYSASYDLRIPGLLWALGVGLASAMLSLELLRGNDPSMARLLLYAAVTGLVLGETAWSLDYWSLGGLKGGIFLLLLFYTMTGVAQTHFLGRLSRGVVLEFGLVTLAGLALLFTSLPWP